MGIISCCCLICIVQSQQEKADEIIKDVNEMEHPIGKFIGTLVRGFAYAGTGDVLQIQRMLHIAAKSAETKEEEDPLGFEQVC